MIGLRALSSAVECHLHTSPQPHRRLVLMTLAAVSKRRTRYIYLDLVRLWYGRTAGKTIAGCGHILPIATGPNRQIDLPLRVATKEFEQMCSGLVRSWQPPGNVQLHTERPHDLIKTLFKLRTAHGDFGWQCAAGLNRFEKYS